MGFVKTHRRHSPLRVHPSPPSPDPRPYASLRPRHSQITAFLPTDSGGEPNKRVTPHVLRHTAAMDLLHHGVDRSVIALWLGHECIETTQIYLHADMRLKEQALARTTPLGTKPGRYRPDDQLLAFLDGL